MQLKSALVAMSNDARGWLKTWARDFPEARAKDSAGTPANPLAWQLGHIAVAEGQVVHLFGGPDGIVPGGVNAACGTSCPAPTDRTHYPPLTELWDILDRTHAALITVVEQATTDADFDRPGLTENPFFRTLGQSVYELALHENYHVGQIATLRKALGLGRIG